MIKNSQKAGNRGGLLNLIRNISKKPTPNIILNSERLNALPLRSGTYPPVNQMAHHLEMLQTKGYGTVGYVALKTVLLWLL